MLFWGLGQKMIVGLRLSAKQITMSYNYSKEKLKTENLSTPNVFFLNVFVCYFRNNMCFS